MTTRVFIADDNTADLELIEMAFEEAHVQVHCVTAMDGLAAMSVLKTFAPDLVLLDINMPSFDGFEVLRWLRGDLRLCDVPVTIMSSSSTDRDRQRAMELGAQRLWTKPMCFQDMVSFAESLKELLEFRSPLPTGDSPRTDGADA